MNPGTGSFLSALLLSIGLSVPAYGQAGPTGTWRTHFYYDEIIDVVAGSNEIYAISPNGFFFLDRTDGAIITRSQIDGLTANDFSCLAYDEQQNQLWIGYRSGAMDLFNESNIETLDFIADLDFNIEKTIRHIDFVEGRIYLSTSFGVIVLNRNDNLVRESYTDLGSTSRSLGFSGAAHFQDSLYLASDQGLWIAPLSDSVNLQNPANYVRAERFGAVEIRSIAQSGTTLALATETGGWIRIMDDWQQVFGDSMSVEAVDIVGDQIYYATSAGIYTFNATNSTLQHLSDEPANAILGGDPSWAATRRSGLGQITPSGSEFISPNGLPFPYPTRIKVLDQTVYAFEGELRFNLNASQKPGRFARLSDTGWENFRSYNSNKPANLPQTFNIIDGAYFGGLYYFASFGDGLYRWDGIDQFERLDGLPPEISNNLSTLHASADALWVANYGTSIPLARLNVSSEWSLFPISDLRATEPADLVEDSFRNLWIRQDPARSGGIHVFDPENGTSRFLSTQSNQGGLPSPDVNDLAIDQQRQIWIGTPEGIVYFPAFSEPVQATTIDAIFPIYQESFLLNDQVINCLATDAGNRKWIGTNQGLWLVSSSGDQIFENFTKVNSPLPSNQILELLFNDESGELFVSTPRGLVSYQTNSKKGSRTHANRLKIYPNPVPPDFDGMITFEGLAQDALLKITDISGQLVYTTESYGSRTSWNGILSNGEKAPLGIYLVFSSTPDGEDTLVGKFVIVD